ncbi:hypothetical protein PG993_006235 [Apiospora rasikravindrae]|uniref:Uncharacterized protein n=1 Tax=Apiospora rasikravindrae TaxID=990691 RepID=A0ABR1T553_9PEZI
MGTVPHAAAKGAGTGNGQEAKPNLYYEDYWEDYQGHFHLRIEHWEELAPSEQLVSTPATPFPQCSRFPVEIQIMIWEQYIQIERANRVVFVTSYTGLIPYEKEYTELHRAGLSIPQGLRVLPSRWLVSPLFSVDTTDRFLDRWFGHFEPNRFYGLRALSDAFLEYKYHGTPFDFRDLLERRQRPAPLRYYSAGLPDDVLDQIRHLVFPNNPYEDKKDSWRSEYRTKICRQICPKALGPEGTIPSFHSSEEMERNFLDDVEDKGAEHLQIRQVKTELVPVPGRWKEVVVLEPLS